MIEISKVIRTKRKTLSVSVATNGEVIVKAPLNLPESEIHRFLNEKRAWIEAKVKKANEVQDKYRDILEYRQLLYLGNAYFGYSSPHVKKITIQENRILFPSKIQAEKLHKKVIGWYKKLADQTLIFRVKEISRLINIIPSSVKCTGSRGRWGACNNSRQIFLNWRCIMLPKTLIDYIIVHELSHIFELNHSPKFWSIVEHILPDYKLRRSELKKYGFLLKLF